jgi:hypothetical protein
MATPTYTALATTTLSGTDSAITFASIPSSFRDLVLVVEAKISGSAGLRLRLNNDSGSNYNQVVMRNNGGSPLSTSYSGETAFYPSDVGLSVDVPFNYICHIMDYSATDKHKSLLIRTNTNAATVEAHALRWASTTAVNEVNVFLSSQNYQAGSTFSLYGIEA